MFNTLCQYRTVRDRLSPGLGPLGTSGWFAGAVTSKITTPDAPAIEVTTQSFSIEFWMRLPVTSGRRTCVGKRTTQIYAPFVIMFSTGKYELYMSSTGTSQWDVANAFRPLGQPDLLPDTWGHFALTRNGSAVYMHTEGIYFSVATLSTEIGLFNNGEALTVGGGQGLTTDDGRIEGWMDEFRFRIGSAIYPASDFTPPTAPFAYNALDTSHLHFGGADGSTTFTDENGLVWTAVGDAQIDNAQYKF